jgi:hypothetical protein
MPLRASDGWTKTMNAIFREPGRIRPSGRLYRSSREAINDGLNEAYHINWVIVFIDIKYSILLFLLK